MIEYVSITGGSPAVDFETAVLNGKAPDGGLYVPTSLPKVTQSQLAAWKNFSYRELCYEILSLFIDESAITAVDLKTLIDQSFEPFYHPQVIAHHRLESEDNLIVQELFHGPTLSFHIIPPLDQDFPETLL